MEGFVYIIHAVGTNRVKVGYSVEPTKRLLELQTGSPFPLALMGIREGTIALEQAIHRRLQEYHQVGEWFEIDPAQCLAIALAETLPPPVAKEVKADPFALADLDTLAGQILRETASIQQKHPGVDLSPVSNLANQMREKVAAVMMFFVGQVE